MMTELLLLFMEGSAFDIFI